MEKCKTKPKVIIVGGGAAGIAAASRLVENGISDIIILEAQNRIGGRIHTVNFGDGIVELGAQWCHGEGDNIVYKLASGLGVLAPSFNNYHDYTYYTADGVVLNKSKTDDLLRIADELYYDKSISQQSDGTFGEFFIDNFALRVSEQFGDDPEIKTISKMILDWYHKFFLCLEAADNWFEISAKGDQVYQHCAGDSTLNWKHFGFKTLIDILGKKFGSNRTPQLQFDDKIFLNKEVTKIIWDNNTGNPMGVTVDCQDGSSYDAHHVIVTVSLGVLKDSLNLFTPQLPRVKANAIRGLGFGNVGKILLKFPEKWWSDDEKGFSLVWSEEESKKLLSEFPHNPSVNGRSWLEDVFGFYVIDSHPKVLLGWIVGEMAGQVELLSDQDVIDGCMYLLKKFVGSKYNICDPDDILRTKWRNNRYFNGTYSFYSIEAEKRGSTPDDLATPLISSNNTETVLFAGEATHPIYFSTVHGAVESGFREADRLIQMYKTSKGIYRRIVIVGAGMAGLGAALSLLDAGLDDILILEAQSRAGGRICTLYWNDHMVELGAQWLHARHNALYDFASKNGLLSDETSEEGLGVYVRENGDIVDGCLIGQVKEQVEWILNDCEGFVDAVDYPPSVGDYMTDRFCEYLETVKDNEHVNDIKVDLFDWRERYEVVDNACLDLFHLSAKSWGTFAGKEGNYNFSGGYQTLVDKLVQNVPKDAISYSSAVSHIQYGDGSSGKIKLTCQNGCAVFCDHVIVTVSLGVLKSSLHFSPPLPRPMADAIKGMGFHGIGKIFLIFAHKWWSNGGLQIVWNRNTVLDGEAAWTRYLTGFDSVLNSPNTLLGWVGGRGVAPMEALTEHQVGVHCVTLLRNFTRNYHIPDPMKVFRTRWSSNPWFKGAYSYTTPDCDLSGGGVKTLAEPVFADGRMRILLAGEAVHPSQYSTVHGAFESGQNQARVLYNSIATTHAKL